MYAEEQEVCNWRVTRYMGIKRVYGRSRRDGGCGRPSRGHRVRCYITPKAHLDYNYSERKTGSQGAGRMMNLGGRAQAE